MLLKIVTTLIAFAFTFAAGQGATETTGTAVPAVAQTSQTELVDTLVCPQQDEVMQYLESGFSDQITDCSLVPWSAIEGSQSLGTFPAYYQDWADVSDDAPSEVKLYVVKIDSLRLYAVRDPVIDEHWLETDTVGEAFSLKSGILPGVAYDVWEDLPDTPV